MCKKAWEHAKNAFKISSKIICVTFWAVNAQLDVNCTKVVFCSFNQHNLKIWDNFDGINGHCCPRSSFVAIKGYQHKEQLYIAQWLLLVVSPGHSPLHSMSYISWCAAWISTKFPPDLFAGKIYYWLKFCEDLSCTSKVI